MRKRERYWIFYKAYYKQCLKDAKKPFNGYLSF